MPSIPSEEHNTGADQTERRAYGLRRRLQRNREHRYNPMVRNVRQRRISTISEEEVAMHTLFGNPPSGAEEGWIEALKRLLDLSSNGELSSSTPSLVDNLLDELVESLEPLILIKYLDSNAMEMALRQARTFFQGVRRVGADGMILNVGFLASAIEELAEEASHASQQALSIERFWFVNKILGAQGLELSHGQERRPRIGR